MQYVGHNVLHPVYLFIFFFLYPASWILTSVSVKMAHTEKKKHFTANINVYPQPFYYSAKTIAA